MPVMWWQKLKDLEHLKQLQPHKITIKTLVCRLIFNNKKSPITWEIFVADAVTVSTKTALRMWDIFNEKTGFEYHPFHGGVGYPKQKRLTR